MLGSIKEQFSSIHGLQRELTLTSQNIAERMWELEHKLATIEAASKLAERDRNIQDLINRTYFHPKWPSKIGGKACGLQRFSLIAIDCEMVAGVGNDMALARLAVVGEGNQFLMDKIVRPPERILDYRTEITGLTEASFHDVYETPVHAAHQLR